MPRYEINTIIGLGIDVKEELINQISLKLRKNGYPPTSLTKIEYKDLGLVYWTFKTDKSVPDELLGKIEQEAGKLNEKENVRINRL